jgi:sugar phosphate isomerase/epimerase
MNKIGIRAHDIGKMSCESLADKVKSLGFDGVQLVFKKALDIEVDFNDLNLIKKHFTNPMIMMLGAYFNPVHPDSKIVTQGIDYFKKHLEVAFSLNTKYVGTETGSLMGSPWSYVKENHEQKALDDVIEVIKDLVAVAEKKHSYIAIEGAYAHVAYSPKRIKEIINQVSSPNLKVTIDLFNYLHIGNYKKRMEIFEECLNLLKDEIVIYHFKDFVVQDQDLIQVGLGQGLMDYPNIIKRIQETTPDAYLIFEGVTGDDIEHSLTYIKQLIEGK